MRIAIAAAALGILMGAPVLGPTSFVSEAQAQNRFEAAQNAVARLTTEILNATDQAAIDAIIARESATGNFNFLAEALADAAERRAATDVSGAADLILLAITAAENGGDDAQIIVGLAASAVASTAEEIGLEGDAQEIETAVQNSSDPDVNTAYVIAGGNAAQPIITTDTGGPNPNTGTGTGGTTTTDDDDTSSDDDDTTTTGDDTTTTTGDDTTTTTGDDTTTTTGGDTPTPTPNTGSLTPILPPPPTDPIVPIVPEPNPGQSSDSPV